MIIYVFIRTLLCALDGICADFALFQCEMFCCGRPVVSALCRMGVRSSVHQFDLVYDLVRICQIEQVLVSLAVVQCGSRGFKVAYVYVRNVLYKCAIREECPVSCGAEVLF